MEVWKLLTSKLHGLIDAGPNNTPVFNIVRVAGLGLSEVVVADLYLTLTYDEVVVVSIDLSTGTVADVVAVLDALPDYTSTLTDSSFETMLARGLYGDPVHDISLNAFTYYPTSLYVSEMRTYGWTLEEQWGRVRLAENQLYIASSTGQWLDYWGQNYLGVDRYEGESDADYSGRIIGELVRPTQNNKALETLVKDSLDVDIEILDAWPVRSQLDPSEQDYAMAKFLLGISVPNELSPSEAQELIDRVKNVVRSKKAAGTEFVDDVLVEGVSLSETVTVAETLAVAIIATLEDSLAGNYLEYGSNIFYGGDPILTYGQSDEIVEQVRVRKLLASNDSIVTEEIYGG